MMELLKALCVFTVLQCIEHGAAESDNLDCYTRKDVSASSCSVGGSCLSDHPPGEELQQCRELYAHREPAVMPSYAQECPKDGQHYLRCDQVVNHTPLENDYFLIQSVHSELFSLDPQHFAVNVSWVYPDAVQASTLPPLSKRLRGYEVRIRGVVRGNNTVVGCWCLSDPDVFGIELGTGLLHYSLFTSMKIEVLTLPFDPTYGEDYYLASQSRSWPRSCYTPSVRHSPDSCAPPLSVSPWDVRVTSVSANSTKQLAVSWSHNSPAAPPPHVYYVYGASKSDNFSVMVNETRHVTITGLNTAERYTIWVQGYSRCSGTSSFISTEGIGCGHLSDGVTDTTIPVEPTTTELSPLPQQISLLVPLILMGLAILVLVILTPLSVLLGVVLYRCNYCCSKKPSPIPVIPEEEMGYGAYTYKQLKVKPDVLVLYSLKTPKSEQELIERCVVARLKQWYHVNSCNDHTEKTIMQWVEEQARYAHSVLIVCNKSFHGEWDSDNRGPLLNSLVAIINSAVSHDNISKYATVLLKSGSDKFVPGNLYIKGMTRFIVETEKEDADIPEDIFSFLKQNSKIRC